MNPLSNADDIGELRAACSRSIYLHGHPSVRVRLERLAGSRYAERLPDEYGNGGIVATLEEQMAQLLGKEAALFFSRGVVAQMTAARLWAEHTSRGSLAVHRASHIALSEKECAEISHGLTVHSIGEEARVLSLRDLRQLTELPGAVSIELPLRRAGFLLPEWTELEAISNWCRDRGVPLHFDGARLWESAPHYARKWSEIAALSDSVYVSLHKSLGGFGGSVLAGTRDFIAKARRWRGYQAGALPNNAPLAIGALEGIDRHLPRMAEYCERARRLAAALRSQPGIQTIPEVPQTNGFHALLPLDVSAVDAARRRIARDRSVWLLNKLLSSAVPGHTGVEFWIGEASDAVPIVEIVELMKDVLDVSG